MHAPTDPGPGGFASASPPAAPVPGAASEVNAAAPPVVEPDSLLGDVGLLALHTRAILAETGLSYREQETRTGVSASAVYALAHGRARWGDAFAVRRFAAFAAHRARGTQARAYWHELSERLARDESRRVSPPAARGAAAAVPAAGRAAARALLQDALGPKEGAETGP